MFTHWKTTLFGIAAGGFQLAANGLDLKHVLGAVALAALGIFAKDLDKSNAAAPLSVSQKVN